MLVNISGQTKERQESFCQVLFVQKSLSLDILLVMRRFPSSRYRRASLTWEFYRLLSGRKEVGGPFLHLLFLRILSSNWCFCQSGVFWGGLFRHPSRTSHLLSSTFWPWTYVFIVCFPEFGDTWKQPRLFPHFCVPAAPDRAAPNKRGWWGAMGEWVDDRPSDSRGV